MKSSLALLAALIIQTTASYADVLWAWNLSGDGAGNLLSTTTAENLTAAILSRGPGLTEITSLSNIYQSIDWTTSASPDLDDYLEITLSASPGYEFSLTSIHLDHGGGTTAPADFVLRCSLDDYATDLGSFIYSNRGNLESDDFLGLTITGQSSLTLRIYGYNSAGGTWGIFSPTFGPGGPDELIIHGAVTAVPEPATLALAVSGIAVITAFRQRRCRKV